MQCRVLCEPLSTVKAGLAQLSRFALGGRQVRREAGARRGGVREGSRRMAAGSPAMPTMPSSGTSPLPRTLSTPLGAVATLPATPEHELLLSSQASLCRGVLPELEANGTSHDCRCAALSAESSSQEVLTPAQTQLSRARLERLRHGLPSPTEATAAALHTPGACAPAPPPAFAMPLSSARQALR